MRPGDVDLHGRSLLKEVDFTKEEFLFLVARRSVQAMSVNVWSDAISP